MENKFLKAMKERYACKEFDIEKKINKEDFDFILEAGRLSPSSFGFEPWQFLVITNPEKKLEVTEHSWGGRDRAVGASHFMVVITRKNDMKNDSEYLNTFMKDVQKLPEEVVELKTKHFGDFQREDFKLFESDRALADWASKQSYIALGNMLTAAAYIGINSCPIEGFNKEKTNKVLAEKFGVDIEKFDIAYMAAFGYEKRPQEFPKTRRPIEDVVKYF